MSPALSTLAVLVAISAWICTFRRPPGVLGYAIVAALLLLGAFFALVGGLNYWWDRSMQPGAANLLVPVCGVLTLLSHAHWIVVGFLENEGGQAFPRRPRRQNPPRP